MSFIIDYLPETQIDKNSSYEQVRRHLIRHNFVLHIFDEAIEKKINYLSKVKESGKWTNWHINTERSHSMQAYALREAILVLDKCLYIGGENVFEHDEDVLFVETDDYDVAVSTPGIYVRYDPTMNLAAWNQKYKQAEIWAKESKVYEKIPKNFFKYPRTKIKQRIQIGKKDIEQNIPIYLAIEKKLPKLWKLKKSQKGYSLVDGAIEEYIFNSTNTDKLNDKELDSLKERYRSIYYEIANRYSLPRPTELPKFLERLKVLSVNSA